MDTDKSVKTFDTEKEKQIKHDFLKLALDDTNDIKWEKLGNKFIFYLQTTYLQFDILIQK